MIWRKTAIAEVTLISLLSVAWQEPASPEGSPSCSCRFAPTLYTSSRKDGLLSSRAQRGDRRLEKEYLVGNRHVCSTTFWLTQASTLHHNFI